MDYHIAFCVNNEYAQYVSVAIKSIAEIHKDDIHDKFIIHILTDWISYKNRTKLREEFLNYPNIKISIYIIDDSKLNGLKLCSWPIHAWYRILLPDVISKKIDRILYLDTDTLVVSKLFELFKFDMNNKAIAAVIDYQDLFEYPFQRCGYLKEKRYICSGVMLINLNYWRHKKLTEKIISWTKENEDKIKCPDQDAINFICQDSKIILPLKYGVMNCFLKDPIFKNNNFIEEINDCFNNPIIIHYNSCPPWYKEYQKHYLHDKWMEYNLMLKYKVKRHYQAKGLLKQKIIIYGLFKYIYHLKIYSFRNNFLKTICSLILRFRRHYFSIGY